MQKFDFPRERKLKEKQKFQVVYQRGKSFAGSKSVLYVLHGQRTQIGLAVGKRLGNAVIRNHTKRMMREVIRHHFEELRNGYQLVWVARFKLLRVNLNEYEKSFLSLCHDAGILKHDENG